MRRRYPWRVLVVHSPSAPTDTLGVVQQPGQRAKILGVWVQETPEQYIFGMQYTVGRRDQNKMGSKGVGLAWLGPRSICCLEVAQHHLLQACLESRSLLVLSRDSDRLVNTASIIFLCILCLACTIHVYSSLCVNARMPSSLAPCSTP
jgi:hypothetical protein